MLRRHIHAMQTHTCYADTYMLCRQYVRRFNCVCGLCWLQNLPQFFNKSILAKLHAVYTHGALMHRPGYLCTCACCGSSTVALGREIDGSFTASADTCIIVQACVYIFVQMLLKTSVDDISYLPLGSIPLHSSCILLKVRYKIEATSSGMTFTTSNL